MRISDWSSDVCSSDLLQVALALGEDFDQFRFGHGHGHRGGRQIGGPAEAGPPQYRLLGLVLELLAQQRTELGGAARSVGGRRCLAVLGQGLGRLGFVLGLDRQLQRTALARSEEHTSELPSLMRISYDVFCLKKKKSK